MAAGQKHGRNKKRPAQVRYVAEHRSDKNKRINIERAGARKTSDHARVKAMKVKRGTTRAKRRGGLQRTSIAA